MRWVVMCLWAILVTPALLAAGNDFTAWLLIVAIAILSGQRVAELIITGK